MLIFRLDELIFWFHLVCRYLNNFFKNQTQQNKRKHQKSSSDSHKHVLHAQLLAQGDGCKCVHMQTIHWTVVCLTKFQTQNEADECDNVVPNFSRRSFRVLGLRRSTEHLVSERSSWRFRIDGFKFILNLQTNNKINFPKINLRFL